MTCLSLTHSLLSLLVKSGIMLVEVTVHIWFALFAKIKMSRFFFLAPLSGFPEGKCKGPLEPQWLRLLWLLGSLHCSPSWPKVGGDAAKQRIELRARK